MVIIAGSDVTVTTPAVGRGAWPSKGTGGTLSLDGKTPGRFYRAPASRSVLMPGKLAWAAIRLSQPVSVNDYAVHLAVRAIQQQVNIVADGIFGPNTAAAVAVYQQRHGLVADGIVGPATTKTMIRPLIAAAAGAVTNPHPRLAYLVGGFITWESGVDPGAVGVTTPVDLGLLQINGPAHPTMTIEQRLDPVAAVAFGTKFIEANLDAFPAREADGILAFNLGVGGVRKWIGAGRPTMWGKTDTARYINAVLNAAEAA